MIFKLSSNLNDSMILWSSLREHSSMKKVSTGRIAPAGTSIYSLQIIFNRNLNHSVDKCRNYGNLPNYRNSFRFVPKFVLA